MLFLLAATWTGGTGETGASEETEASDDVEPEYLRCVRENVGVTGEGEARSDDDELCV